jgi:hypothetical protein
MKNSPHRGDWKNKLEKMLCTLRLTLTSWIWRDHDMSVATVCNFPVVNNQKASLQPNILRKLADCRRAEQRMRQPKLSVLKPVRIRDKIDPPHQLVCHKRRLNGGGPASETGKNEAPCHSRCGTIKNPSLLKSPEREA